MTSLAAWSSISSESNPYQQLQFNNVVKFQKSQLVLPLSSSISTSYNRISSCLKSKDVAIESDKYSSHENLDYIRYYEEQMSGLPKVKSWLEQDLRLYQGFWYFQHRLPGTMCMQQHFNARPSDIFVTSFPKTGTTWLKALVFAIVNRTNYVNELHPLLTKLSHDCIPFLEIDIYPDGDPSGRLLDEIPSPRLLSSHAPHTLLPRSIIDSNCKIIYICRDPKDVFISCWHFHSKIIPPMLPQEKVKDFVTKNTLMKAYDWFSKGICPWGPYWDHVLSYWKVSVEFPQTVFFLKYEDMKMEPQLYVKKLAEFLGQPFSSLEEKGVIQHIVDLCSFESLSNLQVNKIGTSHRIKHTNDAFYRKGVVGDWMNHLTLDMGECLDHITKQKLYGSGLTF